MRPWRPWDGVGVLVVMLRDVWLGRRTCDQQVASSTPGRALLG